MLSQPSGSHVGRSSSQELLNTASVSAAMTTVGGHGPHETCSTQLTYYVESNWLIKPLHILWWKFESAPHGLIAKWPSWWRVNSVADLQVGSRELGRNVKTVKANKRVNQTTGALRGNEGESLAREGKQSWPVQIRKTLSVLWIAVISSPARTLPIGLCTVVFIALSLAFCPSPSCFFCSEPKWPNLDCGRVTPC